MALGSRGKLGEWVLKRMKTDLVSERGKERFSEL